jgi:dienelactone hydrolase
MSLYHELKRRNVFRVGIAYVVTAWLVIQVVETIFPAFGMGDEAVRLVVIAFAIGLIPVLILAWIFELTAEGLKKDKDIDRSQSSTPEIGRKLDFIIIGLLIVAVGYFTYDKFVRDPSRDAQLISDTVASLAEVRDLVGERQYAKAFMRAKELDPAFTDESLREELWAIVSRTVNLTSDPPDADVWMRLYDSAEEDWEHLGRTPLEQVHMPFVLARLRLELEGYQTLYVAGNKSMSFQLDPLGALPEGMVRVPGGEFDVFMPGLEHLTMELPDYLIDVTEVTNHQYKQFVDAGGYTDPQYWEQRFVEGGHELSFEEAMLKFQDQTGRPGPGTWEVGTYSDGMANHPVAGVSWYEAVAYGKFAGKQLPTLYHWYWAAYPLVRDFILPYSNFNDEGTVPVGTLDGISRSGAFDMAGNMREWTWNRSDDERFSLGGVDRNAVNGFRLMFSSDNTNLALAQKLITRANRDYFVEQPVSDDIFEVYRRLYAYDAAPLNAEVVSSEEEEHWTIEEIELDAAYGNERLTALLYLPKNTQAPYAPIVYFPGSSAIYRRENPSTGRFVGSFLIKSGRAVLFPIYKGTYERGTELNSDIQNETNAYRENVIQWSKDLGRSLDYLETRPDIEMDELGYLGFSWGSSIAPVIIAMEPRIKASVLLSGGLVLQPTQPEVDPFNFLPRVRIPTRMVNAPNDYFFPLISSQKPFYQFLGAEHKDRILLEGGHLPPLNLVARETLDWFDRYLTPTP